MKTFLNILTAISIVVLCGCSSDDEQPIPNTDITYNKDIKVIIEDHCLACHIDPPINGAPFPLVNYEQVSKEASAILEAISKQTGEVGAMPRVGRLPQATIDKVAQWIDDGLPED